MDIEQETLIVNSSKSIIKNIITYYNKKGNATDIDGDDEEDEDEQVRKLINNAMRDLKDHVAPIRAYGIDQLSKIVTVSAPGSKNFFLGKYLCSRLSFFSFN